MLPLLIHIENTSTQARSQGVFANSPVRVGRNQLNDLVLNESFVSQWHGIVRFDDNMTVYVDLGSTNGTVVNGHRVPKNVEVPINEQVDLRIGPVRLRFVRAPLPQQQVGPGRHTVGPGMEPTGFQKTVFMTTGQMRAGAAHVPQAAEMSQLAGILNQTKPYYDAYRQSFGHVLTVLNQHLQQIEPGSRANMVQSIAQRFPQLAREPEFRDFVARLGVPPSVFPEADAAHFIQRLTSGDGRVAPTPGPQNVAMAMERIGAVLEVYSQAYVELRKGYEQFGNEMAVQVTHDATPLRETTNAVEVLRYLLDWNSEPQARIQELTKAFADLALHQVAMLNGIVEGVRAMLGSISPAAISGSQSDALAKPGIIDILWPWRSAGYFWEYAKRHRTLLEEDRFAREVFGRAFAKAYYMVTGGRMQPDHSGVHSGAVDRTLPPNMKVPIPPPPGPPGPIGPPGR